MGAESGRGGEVELAARSHARDVLLLLCRDLEAGRPSVAVWWGMMHLRDLSLRGVRILQFSPGLAGQWRDLRLAAAQQRGEVRLGQLGRESPRADVSGALVEHAGVWLLRGLAQPRDGLSQQPRDAHL